MITRTEQLERLKAYNPFASACAGDPWEAKYPDVPSINKKVFDGLCRLLAQKARSPSENLAGMVLGEVGSGKTHLIGRILEHTRQARPPASFAYIQPIEDPDQCYRYLLREIVINLLHPVDQTSQLTQIERLIAEIIREYLEKGFKADDPNQQAHILALIAEKPRTAFGVTINRSDIGDRVIHYLLKECPSLWKSFLKVLFQYRFPKIRTAVANWLKGDVIDEEDAALLGITVNPDASDAALEQEAVHKLGSLGLLLARFRQPMLVCFDRLENLDTERKIRALGTMLEFLIDTAQSILPVAFFRGQAWGESFSKKLNQHVTSRLETNRFELEDCTVEQALDLIRARLAFAYGVEQVVDLSPLDERVLREKFGKGFFSPRNVITLVNEQLAEIIDQPVTRVDPLDRLEEEFESQYEAILADFGRYAPDRGRLRCALEIYVRNSSSQRGYETPSLCPGEDKYVDLVGEIRLGQALPIPIALIVDTQLHHASVNASLTRGLGFLEHNRSARVIYIRDKRCPLPSPPSWKATNATLERFRNRGGVVLALNEQDAARWYALALLHYAVTEGDVTIIGDNERVRPISPGEFASFIKDRLHGGRCPCFEALDNHLAGEKGPTGNGGNGGIVVEQLPKNVAQKMVALLRPIPMMMMHSAKLAEALSQADGEISVDEVLAVVSRFTDRFAAIRSKDGVLVMVRKDWLNAQG